MGQPALTGCALALALVATAGHTSGRADVEHAAWRVLEGESDRETCRESETVLCLLGNRFRVEATFATGIGVIGSARSTRVSDGTGLLWLTGESDVHLLVKMLDACSVRGAAGFWVYTAARTELALSLSITDTVTGRRRRSFSPPGVVGPAGADLVTFDDCR
jgi:hypothetical protein